MALLAEELVEEWLNRQGYFTIRGAKAGVREMDLLAVRPTTNGLECRHVEVQASVNPIGYLAPVPKAVRKATGRAAGSAKKRTPEEMKAAIREWGGKKYEQKATAEVRESLAPGRHWTRELVVHRLRHPEELDLLREETILIHELSDVVDQLRRKGSVIERAAGADFVDLVLLGSVEGAVSEEP